MEPLQASAAGDVAARAVMDAIVAQAPIGVVAIGKRGETLVVNDEALRIFSRADFAIPPGGGDDWSALTTSGEPYEVHRWPIFRSLAYGETVDRERVELDRAIGRIVIELSTAPVRAPDGSIAAAVALLQDVTARERRERSASDFITNAAHQLQSPLAAIISSVEVLQAGAKDTDLRDQFLEHLDRETQRLARLTSALMTLARVESGVEGAREEVIEVEPLLFRLVRDAAASSTVSVSASCESGLGVIASADLLEHALAGVLDNAVKYTAEGSIACGAVRVGDSVEISVVDTGSGISEAEQPHVFDRFYRGEAGSGFGVGLAIVRASVEALGGQIELESEPGTGTTVRIRAPRAATVTA